MEYKVVVDMDGLHNVEWTSRAMLACTAKEDEPQRGGTENIGRHVSPHSTTPVIAG